MLGGQHPETLYAMCILGHYCATDGNLEKAEPLLEEALAGCRVTHDRNHEVTDLALASLSQVYSAKRDFKKLGPVLLEAYQIARLRYGPDDETTINASGSVGMFFLSTEDATSAEPRLRECYSHIKNTRPKSFERYVAESRLGRCLVDLKNYAEAEPLLISAYSSLKPGEWGARAGNLPELLKAVAKIRRLYEATGKVDEIPIWSTRFDDLVFLSQPFAPP